MANVHKIRQEICEIGKRLYQKGFAAANDGNLSCRVSPTEVVCTPVAICKGFMKPDDLCVCNMEGNQVSGRLPCTSEVNLHLAIMKARPEANAVVHCHPPHATAFGIAREPVPQCILPEVEIFLGEVPISPYQTPGSPTIAEAILPLVKKANVVILANHGTVSWGETIEQAFWRTEILDAYCRVLMLARGLGRVNYFTEPEARELLQLKQNLGLADPRTEIQNCDICANDVFRESWKAAGAERKAFCPPSYAAKAAGQEAAAAAPSSGVLSPDQEALVQAITDRVMAAVSGRG